MGTDRLSDQLALDPTSDTTDQVLSSDRTGIIPRAIHTIFSTIQHQTIPSNQVQLRTSYVEIYNEDLIDLISSSTAPANALPQVTIREDKDGHIIWSGLKEVKVSQASEALNLLEAGNLVRQTNSTEMNAQSSRSHAIFSINLTQRKPAGPPPANTKRLSKVLSPSRSSGRDSIDEGEWSTVTSKFHFVDLAGSERLKRTAAVGERVKEGISINAGLHALGNVISALGDPAKSKTVTHIPYRDSKLTRLLQDSLGGNAYTLMIACVSPSEHNLGETLNTLKYANRARNIKNRAQVNAQEVGWEDVEYLQSTIVKLRKELAQLKSSTSPTDFPGSSRVLSSIDEEDSAQDERSPKYLDLKGHFTELQAKYAKTLSDLAQAQNNLQLASHPSGQPSTFSQSAFDDMIQPIVEEYEKSITALESQLALTKAALVHSEHSMKQLELQLINEQTLNENQVNYVTELKARLNRLSERETENESYIKDLELKLKSLTESQETANDQTNELKKELGKIKEHDAHSEAYIKDLETKLSKMDLSDLVSQISSLEAQLCERDERYNALQEKFDDLSAQMNGTNLELWNQQQELTKKLKDQVDQVNDLQATLRQLEGERDELEIERQKVEAAAQESSRNNFELAERLKALESANKADSITVGSDHASSKSSLSAHLSVHLQNLTPPATPAAISEAVPGQPNSGQAGSQLLEEFHELQERYDATVNELDQVRAKYNNSLKEMEDMSAQLEDARIVQSSSWMPRRSLTTSSNHFRQSGSNFGSPFPSPVMQSPSLVQPSNPLSNHGVLPVRGFGAPVTSGRSSKYLDGKPPLRPKEEDTLEELDSTASNGVSGSGSLEPQTRSMPLSVSSDSFVIPNRGSIASKIRNSSDSRSASPSTSRPPHLNDASGPYNGERSYESLQKEVIKLQEVLRDREDEIRTLEVSIREIRRLDDSISPSPGSGSTVELDDETSNSQRHVSNARASTVAGVQPNRESASSISLTKPSKSATSASVDPDGSAYSDRAFEAIRSQMLLDGVDDNDSQHVKLLDNMMRSMAQKESAHLELIESLKDKLQSTRRQHDELVKLSRDQVVNMSSEIESLRSKLTQPQSVDSQVSDRLLKLEQRLLLKEQELESKTVENQKQLLDLEVKLLDSKQAEIKALKAEHDSMVEKLQIEQHEILNELIASSESKLRAKQDELKQVESQWQAKLDAGLIAQAKAIRFEFDDERQKLLEDQAQAQRAALLDQQNRYDRETHELLEQHAQSIDKVQNDLNAAMKNAELKFKNELEELEQTHARELTQVTSTLTLQENKGDSTIKKLVKDHQAELDALHSSHTERLKVQRSELEAEKAQLISRHEEQLQSIRAQHQAELSELKVEHEEILVASLTELDLRRTRKFESNLKMMQEQHSTHIEELKLEHQKQLQALHESNAQGNSSLSAASSTGLMGLKKPDDEATVTLRSESEKLKDSYERKIDSLMIQHQADLHALEESILSSTLSVDLQEERKANLRKIEVLTDELDYLKEELQKQKNQDLNQESVPSEAEVELQEALDALSTLDKALLESQAERERLLKQLEEMKELNSSDQLALTKEMDNLRSELDRVKQERDELVRSKDSINSDQPQPPSDNSISRSAPLNSDSPSLPGLPSRTQLLGTAKPPPPTPPPSMPPPPLPSSLSTLLGNNPGNLPVPNGIAASSIPIACKPTRTSNSSSQLSHTNNSISGSESSSTSVATSCLIDATVVDPRMVQKLEEQESAIAKLTKQLSQCEIDLKGNIDLVTNLESALNETERNLRKSRLQMNELAKERDKISTQNESLRRELAAANLEVENVRNNVLAEKVQFENQLGEERRAKENAKKQLEARMEEMQAARMTRKSKFNCF